MEIVASLSQGRTAAAQCGLFTHKSVSVIFEPPCTCRLSLLLILKNDNAKSYILKVFRFNGLCFTNDKYILVNNSCLNLRCFLQT